MDKRRSNCMIKLLCFFLVTCFSFLHGLPPQWIDIPDDNYAEISGFQDVRFEKLNKCIKSYHSIPKNLADNLSDRIVALDQVLYVLGEWLASDFAFHHRFFLENIQIIAINKQIYLKSLEEIALQGTYKLENLEKYHLDITPLEGWGRPIFLCNHRMYDSLNGQYWGEYWMETLDPCHRQLTPYYELFRKRYGIAPSLFDFFLWLEDQNLAKDVPHLFFLNESELNKVVVFVKNGLLYQMNGQRLELIDYCDQEEEYIFNIDLKGQLFLIQATKNIHHVSLSHGKPVLGCGNMIVKDGKIVNIELESGHYLPTVEHGVQTLHIFQKLGIALGPNTTFSYYHAGKHHKETVIEFLSVFESESPSSFIEPSVMCEKKSR